MQSLLRRALIGAYKVSSHSDDELGMLVHTYAAFLFITVSYVITWYLFFFFLFARCIFDPLAGQVLPAIFILQVVHSVLNRVKLGSRFLSRVPTFMWYQFPCNYSCFFHKTPN